MKRVRPAGLPFGLDALGLNLRTYTRFRGGEPAIYPFSLDTDSAVLVAGGRVGLGLPYHLARLRTQATRDAVAYSLERRSRPRVRASLRVAPGPRLAAARPGSLEAFLVERYFIHGPRAARLVATVQISHPPFDLGSAQVEHLAEDLTAAARVPAPDPASLLAHTSPGAEVALFAPGYRLSG